MLHLGSAWAGYLSGIGLAKLFTVTLMSTSFGSAFLR